MQVNENQCWESAARAEPLNLLLYSFRQELSEASRGPQAAAGGASQPQAGSSRISGRASARWLAAWEKKHKKKKKKKKKQKLCFPPEAAKALERNSTPLSRSPQRDWTGALAAERSAKAPRSTQPSFKAR